MAGCPSHLSNETFNPQGHCGLAMGTASGNREPVSPPSDRTNALGVSDGGICKHAFDSIVRGGDQRAKFPPGWPSQPHSQSLGCYRSSSVGNAGGSVIIFLLMFQFSRTWKMSI